MARPKNPNTSGLKPPWPKGFCPNPGGKPKHTPPFTYAEAEAVFQRCAVMSQQQLADLIKSPEARAVDIAVAVAWTKALNEGRIADLDQILNRAVGRVIERVETNVSPYVIEFRDGSKLALGSSAKDVIEGEVVEEKDDKPVQE